MKYLKGFSFARISSVFIVVLCLFVPTSAFAHTLKVDGHVGAILHVEPSDEPIAGQPTAAYLEFKNDEQQFDLSAYTLAITITDGSDHVSHTIPRTDLHQEKNDTASFTYNFPKKDVYALSVNGTPNNSTAPAFTLTYDIRIDQEATPAHTPYSFLNEHVLHVVIIGGGILIGGFITIRDERKRRKVLHENSAQK